MPMLRRALFVVTSSLLHQVWHTDVLGYSRGIFSCTTPYSPIGSGECGTWNRRFAGKYALSGREHIDWWGWHRMFPPGVCETAIPYMLGAILAFAFFLATAVMLFRVAYRKFRGAATMLR